jgi:DNA-binding GntR family transcriptional regulator
MVRRKNKKKESMSETVYHAVKEMVYLNRFKPGLRLNVERLSRELSVSRTPAWEAIRRLEEEGIVRKVPHRGVFMVESSLERVREQVLVLNALDKLAGALACGRMTEGTLEKLSGCLADQLRGIETEDLILFGAAEMQFHGHIYKASGLFYLKELFDLISSQMLPTRLNFLPALPAMYSANVELIEALRDRDLDRVQKAADDHIQAITDSINKQMKSEAERKEMVRRVKERHPSPDKTGI